MSTDTNKKLDEAKQIVQELEEALNEENKKLEDYNARTAYFDDEQTFALQALDPNRVEEIGYEVIAGATDSA